MTGGTIFLSIVLAVVLVGIFVLSLFNRRRRSGLLTTSAVLTVVLAGVLIEALVWVAAKAHAQEQFRQWVADKPQPRELKGKFDAAFYPIMLLGNDCELCLRPEWFERMSHIVTRGDPERLGEQSYFEVVRSCEEAVLCTNYPKLGVGLVLISNEQGEKLAPEVVGRYSCTAPTLSIFYEVQFCTSSWYSGDVLQRVDYSMPFEFAKLDLMTRWLGQGSVDRRAASHLIDFLAGVVLERPAR